MKTERTKPRTSRRSSASIAQLELPVAHAKAQLVGVRFLSPVANITTVSSPLRMSTAP
jgi:hypothetical protein